MNKENFEEWKKDHGKDCQANYSGSAPGIETEVAIRIFGRSVQKHGAYYLKYYGNGDSKSYEKVQNICNGKHATKYECIGHYQKRVGNRLRELREKTKGLGGKNKLKCVKVKRKKRKVD